MMEKNGLKEITIAEARKAGMHIWVYGAGVVGKSVLKAFKKVNGMDGIDGVVVTSRDAVETIEGYIVREIGEITTPPECTAFFTAVSAKYMDEVKNQIALRGYDKYILWDNEYNVKLWKLAEYHFDNRKRDVEKVCFVLAGYKDYLWENVFERLQHFLPEDVEVCILSSGVFVPELAAIAKENGWSYLSTRVNDVTMVQNIAISLFSCAKWIYKMDEDIFLTEDCFEGLYCTYHTVESREPYNVGFATALIPVNGYGYIRILDMLGMKNLYEKKFEKVLYGGNCYRMIEKSAEAAQFMWGADGFIPQLDVLNSMLEKRERRYSFCNVRYSIGFILFHRDLWEEMGGFTVSGGTDLGIDEEDLCKFCIINSRAIAVNENSVVGHFSFGQQTEGMKEFYLKNRNLFEVNSRKNS